MTLAETLRRTVYPTLDRVLRRLSDDALYAAYELNEAEFIGETDAELPRLLLEVGYERPGIAAAAKYRPGTRETEDLNLRYVDPDRPRVQYHVHGWKDGETWSVYSHYEYRPDLRPVADETLGEAIQRLREHYSPTWGPAWNPPATTYVLGAASAAVKELVA